MTSAYCAGQLPVAPRLMFSILAGYGLSGTPLTWMPAAHSIPAMMSESRPPHLPSTRTGSSHGLQVRPAIPVPLLLSAPRSPDTRVPCQELLAAVPARAEEHTSEL